MKRLLKEPQSIILVALFILSAANASYSQQETITVTKKHTVRVLRGIVLDANHQPIAGVEVDILDNAEWVRKGQGRSDVEQHLIASTKTDSDGTFNLKDLRAGKYDVRFRAMGFNEMHFYVMVKPHSIRNKRLVVILPVAT